MSASRQLPNQLMDQRDQAVANLSSLIGVSVTNTDGNYNVFVGNGQSLVVGGTQYGVQAVASPSDPSELTLAFQPTGTATATQYLDSNALSGGVVGGLVDQPYEMTQNSLQAAQMAFSQIQKMSLFNYLGS